MMDTADRAAFERSLRHAVERNDNAALDIALADLGWHEALATDEPEAVAILFELLGSTHRASSALEQVVSASLGLEHESTDGLVLPAVAQTAAPGRIDADRCVVGGLGTAALADRQRAWVVGLTSDALVALLVPVADLVLRPVTGMDPSMGLIEVTGTVAVGTLDRIDVTDHWPAALAAAQRAIGHELVGAAATMLELARTHALDRVQFGQPIGQFQAVRHRLADSLVAIESARAVLDAAWEDGTPTTAAVAKALAGRGARTTARHCQQVLAGIGFTTEHDFHHYARRTFLLDQLCGATRSLTRQFGAELLAEGRMPAFAPL
jgi:hypothetical protein